VAIGLDCSLYCGGCVLAVVWMQIRMRDLAGEAFVHGGLLGADYHRLFRLWFLSGFPAFSAVLAITWLMIAKPSL